MVAAADLVAVADWTCVGGGVKYNSTPAVALGSNQPSLRSRSATDYPGLGAHAGTCDQGRGSAHPPLGRLELQVGQYRASAAGSCVSQS